MLAPALFFIHGRFCIIDIHFWGNCGDFRKLQLYLTILLIFCQRVCDVTIVSSLHQEGVYFLMPTSYFTPFLWNPFNISAISTVSLMSSDLYFPPRKILTVKWISQADISIFFLSPSLYIIRVKMLDLPCIWYFGNFLEKLLYNLLVPWQLAKIVLKDL